MKRFVIPLSILFIYAACITHAQVDVSRITYKGWTDCYSISNQHVRIVVVPQIGGRIMEYSLDGENAIWQNDAELGKTSGRDIGKTWHNYGGYKAWNAPLSRNETYIDYFYDSQPSIAEILPDRSGIRVTVSPIDNRGLQFIREISLSPVTTRVRIVEKMKNISEHEVEWSIWGVSQVNTPCWIIFPIGRNTKFTKGWQNIYLDKDTTSQIKQQGNLGIMEYKGIAENWKTDARAGWMAYIKDRLAYTIHWGMRLVGVTYPDNGCDAEFFTAARSYAGGYAEMEIMGPLVKLKPGEETQIIQDWFLSRLNQSAKDNPDVIERLKLLQKRGVLPRSIAF